MDLKSRLEELIDCDNIKEIERLLDDLRDYTLLLNTDLEQLEDDSYFLNCLEMAGVDNWDGYEEAQRMLNEYYSND